MKQLEELQEIAKVQLEGVRFSPQAQQALRKRLEQPQPTRRHKRWWLIPATAAVAACAVVFAVLAAPPRLSVKAEDLMRGVHPSATAHTLEPDDAFRQAVAELGMRLQQQAFRQAEQEGNRLLSPVSLYMTLAVLANGAQGETRAQMDALLGGLPQETRNAMCARLLADWPVEQDGRVSLANSLWIRRCEGLQISPAFLQTNADYFGAAAYRADFADERTLQDMHNWIRYHTDGMIRQGPQKLDQDDMLFVMNTVLFDMRWEAPYEKKDIAPATFTRADGGTVTVDFLSSRESGFLCTDTVTGFVKPYKGGKYSFVGLLPEEGLTLEQAADSLDGDGWLAMLRDRGGAVDVRMPCFSFDCALDMKELLRSLGMANAFDENKADFSALGSVQGASLFLDEVQQKTHLELNAHGTKAAALTWGGADSNAAPPDEIPVVNLNRPFLFAIVETDSGLPLFLGSVSDPTQA